MLTSLSIRRSTVLDQRPTLTHRTLRRTVKTRAEFPQCTGRWASIRRVHGQRPVSVKHSHDFSKLSISAIEKYAFHFLKSAESRRTQTPLYPSNSTAFENVLTPPSVYHNVQVC